jgi:hypothetical protein
MGHSRMHVGGGTTAVWGAGGSGSTAPDWLREAHARGLKSPLSSAQVAVALSSARKRDAASDRDVMNGALVRTMAEREVKGRASVDIDVGSQDKSDDRTARLFKDTRSKAAHQMPNSTGGEKGDSHSGSNEGSSSNEEE